MCGSISVVAVVVRHRGAGELRQSAWSCCQAPGSQARRSRWLQSWAAGFVLLFLDGYYLHFLAVSGARCMYSPELSLLLELLLLLESLSMFLCFFLL